MNIVKIALVLLALVLSWLIYRSVQSEVEFTNDKNNRYVTTIAYLEDMANTQRLYKQYYGSYSDNLDSLKNFIETGRILMVSRKDSSAYVYDAKRRIDVMKSFTIYDTVYSPKSVKDSLFGDNNRLKDFGYVIVGENKLPIEMFATFNDRIVGEDSTNIQRDYFFKGWVKKADVLKGLDEEMIAREMFDQKSPIKDEIISVGSDTRPSLEGNWNTDLDVLLKERELKEANAKQLKEEKK